MNLLTKHLSTRRVYWLEDSEFSQQIFMEDLLCALYRSRCWD